VQVSSPLILVDRVCKTIEIDMTKEQAIEACAKAIVVKNMGLPESNWQTNPPAKDFATNLVTCLEALDLLPKTTSE